MSVVSHYTEAAAKKSTLRLIVKGAASFGLLAIMVVGAVYYVLGTNFSENHQVIAALVGAVVGAGCAGIISWHTSKH